MNQPAHSATVLGSAWRHHWFVLTMAVSGALLALVLATARGTSYKATASLVVTNTAASAKNGSTVIDANPERYVADQVAILKLPTVSARAAQIANDKLRSLDDPSLPTDLTRDDVSAAEGVSNVSGTNLIQISATGSNPTVARVIADSLASAYQSVSNDQTHSSAGSSLESLQAAQAANQKALSEVDAQIATLRTAEGGSGLDEQYRRLLQQLNAGGTITGGAADTTASAIDSLQRIERQLPSFSPLYARRDTLLQQSTAIQSQIDSASGATSQTADNVVVFSPAQEPTSGAAMGKGTLMALGAILGAAVGVAISYWRDARRREFTESTAPGLILDAPMIAEVPDFRTERLRGLLPVIEAPDSVAAEAFRFAVASLQTSVGNGVLGFVSSSVGAGKTVTAANVAIAYAQARSLVLTVDADLKAQGLVHLFPMPGETSDIPGLTELLKYEESSYAKIRLDLGQNDTLDLLPGGSTDIEPAQVFGSTASAALFDRFRSDYEVVIVDVAPVLNVAYATTMLKDVDAVVVVVRHESSVDELEQLTTKLRLFGIPVAGYVYTMAPVSEERAMESTAPVMHGGSRWLGGRPWQDKSTPQPPVAITE